jgi:hypothetical protein
MRKAERKSPKGKSAKKPPVKDLAVKDRNTVKGGGKVVFEDITNQKLIDKSSP